RLAQRQGPLPLEAVGERPALDVLHDVVPAPEVRRVAEVVDADQVRGPAEAGEGDDLALEVLDEGRVARQLRGQHLEGRLLAGAGGAEDLAPAAVAQQPDELPAVQRVADLRAARALAGRAVRRGVAGAAGDAAGQLGQAGVVRAEPGGAGQRL